jgi:hypothetical protein
MMWFGAFLIRFYIYLKIVSRFFGKWFAINSVLVYYSCEWGPATLSTMTLSVMTFSVMTLTIMTVNIQRNDIQPNDNKRNDN